MSAILVTGASGFVGRALTARLIREGHRVVAATRRPDSVRIAGATVVRLDVAQPESFSSLPADIDAIVHAAADKQGSARSWEAIEGIARTNVLGTLNALRFATDRGVKRFVFCSSLSVYRLPQPLPIVEADGQTYPVGNPDSYYGISKLAGELLVAQAQADFSLSTMSLRLGRIYGPGEGDQGLFAEWRAQASRGETIEVYGGGERSLDFIYIDDAVEGICRALVSAVNGVVNLSSGRETTWRDLAWGFVNVFGDPSNQGAVTVVQQGKRTRCYLDVTLAKDVLGFSASHGLEDGLTQCRG